MMNKKILHITDFHISEPDGQDEQLRKRFFREYISSMCQSLKNSEFYSQIDCIVATGDFIDRYRSDNFEHAQSVLKYLADKLDVDAKNIVTCCGNHDFDRELDEAGKPDEARKKYKIFSSNYSNPIDVVGEGAAEFHNIGSDIVVVSMDATLGCGGKNIPGILTDESIDRVISDWAMDRCENKYLIIASHYPAHIFPDEISGGYEKDYFERHFWNSGKILAQRLCNLTNAKSIAWLAGDIHATRDHVHGSVAHMVTGRIGTRVTNPASILRRQARLVSMGESESMSVLFSYDIPTHVEQPHVGEWSEGKEHKYISIATGRTKVPFDDDDEVGDQTFNSSLEVINEKLEKSIAEVIGQNGLYSLGRFEVSEGYTALGWISVGPLMNQGKIMPLCVEKTTKWIKRKCKQLGVDPNRDLVLLGVDCWGAVLASMAAAQLSVESFCVAARGKGRYHSNFEKISRRICDSVKNAKFVCFMTDVIGTGGTVTFLIDEFKKILSSQEFDKIVWGCGALICDKNHDRSDFYNTVAVVGACCTNIPIPVVDSEALPVTEVLPPEISFCE